MHEIIVDNVPWVFVVHDLNPRAMSHEVRDFVFVDLTLPWVRYDIFHIGLVELAGAVRLSHHVRPAGLIGEYDKARQALEEHLALAERNGMKWHIGTAHRLLGEVTLHTNPAEASPHFQHSIALLQQINAENELALAYAGYGRLQAQCGNLSQARTYLGQALDIFERLGTLAEPEKVRQALAALPGG